MKQVHSVYPNLETFTERLNYAFRKQPLSQQQIVALVGDGYTQPSFSELLSGKIKKPRKHKEIAKALNVDHQWLMTGIASEKAIESSLIDINLIDNYMDYINTQQRALIKAPPEAMQLNVGSLTSRNINFFDARFVPMPDKGMGQIINEDSPVFFDTANKAIKDGDVYVISHGGMLLVRKLYNAPMGSIRITSNNESFDNYVLDISQQRDQLFSIIGHVFAVVNYY